MTSPMTRTMFWIPRALGLLYVAFLSVFALDVFGEGLSAGKTILALGMHLLPSAVMLVALTIAWRREATGALLYLSLGVYYCLTMARHHPSWMVVVAGPVFLIGALFLLSSRRRAATAP